jgi:hypothetical protein
MAVPLEEASEAVAALRGAGERLEVEAFTEHGADPDASTISRCQFGPSIRAPPSTRTPKWGK